MSSSLEESENGTFAAPSKDAFVGFKILSGCFDFFTHQDGRHRDIMRLDEREHR